MAEIVLNLLYWITGNNLSGFHSQESLSDLASWLLGQNIIITTNKNKLFLLSY